MSIGLLAVVALLQQDMPDGTAADDLSVVPEFWLFVASGVMTVALIIGIAIFWWRISNEHDRETR
jgi:high-affinity Fe2+/Pb2+ permease